MDQEQNLKFLSDSFIFASIKIALMYIFSTLHQWLHSISYMYIFLDEILYYFSWYINTLTGSPFNYRISLFCFFPPNHLSPSWYLRALLSVLQIWFNIYCLICLFISFPTYINTAKASYFLFILYLYILTYLEKDNKIKMIYHLIDTPWVKPIKLWNQLTNFFTIHNEYYQQSQTIWK